MTRACLPSAGGSDATRHQRLRPARHTGDRCHEFGDHEPVPRDPCSRPLGHIAALRLRRHHLRGARAASRDARRRPRTSSPSRRRSSGSARARDPRPRRRPAPGRRPERACGATGRSSRPGRCAARSTWSPPTSCRSSSAPSARGSTGCARSGSATSRSPRGDARPPGRHRRGAHRPADDPRRPRRGPGEALGNAAFADRVTRSWGTFLKPAASRGLLCFGPDDGRNVDLRRPAAVARARHARAHRGRARRRSSSASSTRSPAAPKGELARWWGVRAARRCASRSPPSATASSRSCRGDEGARPTEDVETLATIDPSTDRPPPARLRPVHAGAAEGGRAAPAARPATAGVADGRLDQPGADRRRRGASGTWTHEVKKGRLDDPPSSRGGA